MTTDTTAEPKPLTEMTREELLRLRPDIESKLRHAKSALADAHRRSERGDRVTPEEFVALEERAGRLSSVSRRIDTELSLRPKSRVESRFMSAARRELPHDVFVRLFEMATAAPN